MNTYMYMAGTECKQVLKGTCTLVNLKVCQLVCAIFIFTSSKLAARVYSLAAQAAYRAPNSHTLLSERTDSRNVSLVIVVAWPVGEVAHDVPRSIPLFPYL